MTPASAARNEPRCYTIPQLLDKLAMSRSAFEEARRAHRLPFLEELRPRLNRSPRYRADLVDRYLAGQWPTHIRSLRRSA